jgi:hypothetical protein
MYCESEQKNLFEMLNLKFSDGKTESMDIHEDIHIMTK